MTSLKNNIFFIDSVARDYPFYNSVNGEKSDKTLFGVRFDGKNLIFRFDCEEEFFCPKYYGYNEPLYEGDIVELMISLGDKNRYLEVEVNQNNANYCVIIINADGKGKISIEKLKKKYYKQPRYAC